LRSLLWEELGSTRKDRHQKAPPHSFAIRPTDNSSLALVGYIKISQICYSLTVAFIKVVGTEIGIGLFASSAVRSLSRPSRQSV
jgi:hypothetical protein